MSFRAGFSLAALCAAVLLMNGCAALSLFGQTHTHHHHYDCESSGIANRLESLERRLTQIEKPGDSAVQYSSHESSE